MMLNDLTFSQFEDFGLSCHQIKPCYVFVILTI